MILETQLVDLATWLPEAARGFVQSISILLLIAGVLGYLIAAVRHGPLVGGDLTFQVIRNVGREIPQISPSRIWAIARLAMKESLRKQVLAVLVLDVLVLLFANWLLDPTTKEPAALYLRFLLNVSLFLVLVIAILMSCFSIPHDFQTKTIYTIVTKPVVSLEIVLGRIVGYSLIGMALLTIMGVLNFAFITRALQHTHTIDATNLTKAKSETDEFQWFGNTSTEFNHYHRIRIKADGTGDALFEGGHQHAISSHQDGDKLVYDVGPAENLFNARVPVYGKLKFLDRQGRAGLKGINTGNEWQYRSGIEGGTRAAAIYRFSNVTSEMFPDGNLPLRMTIRVFRSWKGDVSKPIQASLKLRNPESLQECQPTFFPVKDNNKIDEQNLGKFVDPKTNQPLELFKDLVSKKGDIEVVVECIDRNQYLCFAPPDMWLQAGEHSFTMNFIKGHIGIALRMILITALGVMFSTVVTGSVAMIATVGCVLFGLSRNFISTMMQGLVAKSTAAAGGGPLESIVRILTQANMVQDMDDNWTTHVIKHIDEGLFFIMDRVTSMLPNLADLGNNKTSEFLSQGLAAEIEYVASGFDISGEQLAIRCLACAAYVFGVVLVGYFLLRTREVAR
jgi:hypothetical protein